MNTKQNAIRLYDIIIIYEGDMAESAGDAAYHEKHPFSIKKNNPYNESYSYFLEECAKQNVRAAFTTTNDIGLNGLCKTVWEYREKKWHRITQRSQAKIFFDKFSQKKELTPFSIAVKKSVAKMSLFHNKKIRSIFDNKLKTSTLFLEHTVPTEFIDLSSQKKILLAQKKLDKKIALHSEHRDFKKGYVLKDQFGSGGDLVFKTTKETDYAAIYKKHPLVSFVLQPFVTASGFQFGTTSGIIDLRVIVLNGTIIQSYIRSAKKKEFRANASYGGSVSYIPIEKIPQDVLDMTRAIHQTLKSKHSFYALDFMKSDSGNLYFIEGNITPGLNWFNKTDELYAKKLIRELIEEMKKMID